MNLFGYDWQLVYYLIPTEAPHVCMLGDKRWFRTESITGWFRPTGDAAIEGTDEPGLIERTVNLK